MLAEGSPTVFCELLRKHTRTNYAKNRTNWYKLSTKYWHKAIAIVRCVLGKLTSIHDDYHSKFVSLDTVHPWTHSQVYGSHTYRSNAYAGLCLGVGRPGAVDPDGRFQEGGWCFKLKLTLNIRLRFRPSITIKYN